MISFDLMIFMLGVVMIIYLLFTVTIIVNHRTSIRLYEIQKYNWVMQVADGIVKFGSVTGDIYNDHEFQSTYDLTDYEFKGKLPSAYAMDLNAIAPLPSNQHRVCVSRYGVDANDNKKIMKIIVCVD